MSSAPDRPIILNPEAVGDPGQTPIVQLPPAWAAFFERTRCPECDLINHCHSDDCSQRSLAAPARGTAWTGPTCFMCDGTGEDFTYSGEPMTETRRDVPTGQPCRACYGHGREATP